MKQFLRFFNILIISLILLPITSIFAQFTIDDSTLVKTTFLREFYKNILSEYLNSDNSQKVNSALLSISHSEDTTFIDSIIKLDYSKYGKHILFALGQIGESEKSKQFIFSKLVDSSNQYTTEAFEAIGKVGDSLSFNDIFSKIDSGMIPLTNGFPYAMVNFYYRGITNINSIKYLEHKLSNYIGDDELFELLFAIYRLGPTKSMIPTLHSILKKPHEEKVTLSLLSNFRKLKYFPNDRDLFKLLISSRSWRIRTEMANSSCYFPFKDAEDDGYDELKLYFSNLLNDFDKNPNVARTAAKAIKLIKLPKQNNWIKNEIESYIKHHEDSTNFSENTKGELLISYVSLFKPDIENIVDEYSDFVKLKFIYRLLKTNTNDWSFNFDYLSERIAESSEVDLLDLLPAYLELQNKYLNNKEYSSNLFIILNSKMPSSVSIVAEGLERPMIYQNKKVLQEIILKQVFENLNNSQFAETIISLANLSHKIDRIFYDSVIDILSKSTLYSIKKYALEKQGVNHTVTRDEKLFTKLWSEAFKYKFATVETNKGSFTLELIPQFAPLTCGNFISLGESGYYDGVFFHRVVPNFVIQTGDTTNTGWGGPGYEITSEFSPLPFSRSTVGMASSGKDTEGSQWFVMHSLFPHLNGRYTNWATVIKGMEVVDIVDEGDKVINITLKN